MSKIVWKYFNNTNTVVTEGLKIPYLVTCENNSTGVKEYHAKYGLEDIGSYPEQKEAIGRCEEFLVMVGNGGLTYFHVRLGRKEDDLHN